MATQTPEQVAEIDARFQKAGEQAAAKAQAQQDILDGRVPTPAPKAAEVKPPEKPRDETGKFAPAAKAEEPKKEVEKPKTDHVPALRDALAKAVGKEKAANAAVDSLRAEMAEIKALLKQGIAPQKPQDPEEAKKVAAESRWVKERIMPEFQPVIEAANLILEERKAKQEQERVASENFAKFESYADILDVSPEKRSEAASKILSGEVSADTPDATFLMALKAVMGSGAAAKTAEAEAETASRARAEAEKKAATGIMGRSSPVTEADTNDFQRKIADARKNKDRRTEDTLIEQELTARLLPKFKSGQVSATE